MLKLMKRVALVSAVLLIAIPALGEGPMSKKLEAGDVAPEFELIGSDGKTHKLSDHLGKRPVVIAWFPKAFTGG
jgi:peroxiredoxin Q/BCP